jgi:hypothetical protein
MGLWNGQLGANNGLWRRGVGDIPSRTTQWSRPPPASGAPQ